LKIFDHRRVPITFLVLKMVQTRKIRAPWDDGTDHRKGWKQIRRVAQISFEGMPCGPLNLQAITDCFESDTCFREHR
jgi:hypothetical protein